MQQHRQHMFAEAVTEHTAAVFHSRGSVIKGQTCQLLRCNDYRHGTTVRCKSDQHNVKISS